LRVGDDRALPLPWQRLINTKIDTWLHRNRWADSGSRLRGVRNDEQEKVPGFLEADPLHRRQSWRSPWN